MVSGSTVATVDDQHLARHYDDPVRVIALEAGVTENTVRQWMKPSDPASPFYRVALMLEHLTQASDMGRVERLMLRIDHARLVFHHIGLSDELQQLEQGLDGREDEAQLAYNLEPSATTWDTYRRVLLKHIAIARQVVQAGDAEYGR